MLYLRKYSTATSGNTNVRLALRKAGSADYATSSDWTPAAGDVKVSIDGGAQANIATLPTYSNGRWTFALAAAELAGKQIEVNLVDSVTKAVDDESFTVETFGHASSRYPAVYNAGTAGNPFTASDQLASPQAFDNTGTWSGDLTGNVGGSVGSVAAGVTLADNAVTALALAADAVTEIQAGLHTAAQQTADLSSILTNVGNVPGLVWAYTGGNRTLSGAQSWSLTGNITGNLSGSVGSVAGAVGSVVGAVGSVTAAVTVTGDAATAATRLLTMVELDGSVYRYTTNALEQGPSGGGGGGGATAQQVWEYATRGLTDKADFGLSTGERTILFAGVWAYSARTLTGFGTLVADVASGVWGAGARTLTAFGFTVGTTHADQLDTIEADALSAATNASTAAANSTTLLARLGAFTGTGVNTVLGFLRALMSKAASTPSDVGGTYNATTDSTEAIRDRGDTAWTTGSGGGGSGGATAEEIADEVRARFAADLPALVGYYANGTLSVRRGDSYGTASGQTLLVNKPSGAQWPDLTDGWTVHLTAAKAADNEATGTATLSKECVVVDADSMRIDLLASDTTGLALGTWEWELQASKGDDRNTLVSGVMVVLEDKRTA